jgi:ribosomal protein S13
MQASIYFNPQTSVDVRYFPKSTMVVVLSAKRIEKMHCEALIGLKFRSVLPCRGQRARLQAREINAPLQTRRNHR